MSSNGSYSHSVEYLFEEIFSRLQNYLQKSLIMIFIALGVVITTVMYLLRPVNQCQAYPSIIEARSCSSINTILPNKDSRKSVTAVENDPEIKTLKEKSLEDNILNRAYTVEQLLEETLDASSFAISLEPSEHSLDERFIREIGFSGCVNPPYQQPVNNA